MIVEKQITIKVVARTLNYWLSKGYLSASVGCTLLVSIEDLPKKSNVYLECVCDRCAKTFNQRFSRNTDVCGYCRTSQRLKGNILGKSRTKHALPSKEEILEHIKCGLGKKAISELYNVSIPVVNRWFKEYDIQIKPYFGKLFFKTDEEKEDKILALQSKLNKSITELSNDVGLPRHIIKKLRDSGEICIKTQFDIWNESYKKIVDNLPFYVSENKTKNLKTISDENNVSLEQLKKAFVENNICVQLHSYNKSKGELECLDFIKSLGEQTYSAMIDKKYEIDCYVPKKHFGVEYCGEFWHRYVDSKNNKYYHKEKMKFAKERGVDILTIFESEWILKKDIIKSMIKSRLGYNTRIYARKCQVKEIRKRDAELFHENNHLSGYTNSSINVGLYYDGQLLSVLSLIKSRFDKTYEYEISRFSSLQGYTVVGGLSRLFSYFVKKYRPISCISYVDMRVGDGKSYEKIGFFLIGETSPNYYYYHKNKKFLESRMKYQKHKLKSMKSYSPYKTEKDIMEDAGYYRIYDCGNKKYGWKNASHP